MHEKTSYAQHKLWKLKYNSANSTYCATDKQRTYTLTKRTKQKSLNQSEVLAQTN